MNVFPSWTRLRQEASRAWLIAKKDIRLYYAKPPILAGGILLPFVLFLSFSFGRNQPVSSLIPTLAAMWVFFTSSTIGPAVIPWEKTSRTFERLLTAPISLMAVLMGKIWAGMIFGVGISLTTLIIGSMVFGAKVTDWFLLVLGLLSAAGAFSALGILFSALPRRDVGSAMMLSMIVRWPLLFISGLFVPVTALGTWGERLAWLSPLTFTNDVLLRAMGHPAYYSSWIDLLMLTLFGCVFLWLGLRLHELGRQKGI